MEKENEGQPTAGEAVFPWKKKKKMAYDESIDKIDEMISGK